MVTIILLNYKGWRDTIACLESLRKQSYTDFRVVVADNGSSDESVAQLSQWAKEEHIEAHWLQILAFDQNYGFAKGNNKAIEAVKDLPSDYYLCLNNDTEMEPDCLQLLVEYMEGHPEVTAVTPGIRLYDRPERMWNAGGRLVFGGRRYYYMEQPAKLLDGKDELPITFITGCALLVRRELIAERPLFTERFFFGEEDFEFSLRMQKEGHRMVCLPTAVMYHKVGGSQTQVVSYNKLFIHQLNRIINLRSAYSKPKYVLWMMLYVPYVYIRFLGGMSMRERNRFMRLLLREARINDSVSKELFEKYIAYPFHAQ